MVDSAAKRTLYVDTTAPGQGFETKDEGTPLFLSIPGLTAVTVFTVSVECGPSPPAVTVQWLCRRRSTGCLEFFRDDFSSSYNVPLSSGSHTFGDFDWRVRCFQDSVLGVLAHSGMYFLEQELTPLTAFYLQNATSDSFFQKATRCPLTSARILDAGICSQFHGALTRCPMAGTRFCFILHTMEEEEDSTWTSHFREGTHMK